MMDSWEKFLVLWKKTYKTFFDMMTQEWIKKVLPDKDDILDWVNTVYYRFYSKEEEKEFWISAIELNFLKD